MKTSIVKKLFFAFVVVGTLFTLASNPWADFAGTDSGVYSYIGQIMHEGRVPYRDAFDHKGPLIYFLNYLGTFVHGMIGVWIVECAFLLGALVVLLRFLRATYGDRTCLWTICLYLPFFAFLSNGGNLPESYAHFFVVVALMLLLEAVHRRTTFSNGQSFAAGVCFGVILLLKPNMAGIVAVTAVYFIDCYIRGRDFRRLLVSSLCVFGGMGAIILPFLIYLLGEGAVCACFEDYWLFNLKYASSRFSWSAALLLPGGVAVLSMATLLFARDRRMALYNFIFVLLTGLVISIKPNAIFYYLPLMPGLILVIAEFETLSVGMNRLLRGTVLSVCSLAVCLAMFFTLLKTNLDFKAYWASVRNGGSALEISRYREGWDIGLFGFDGVLSDRTSVGAVGNACYLFRPNRCRCRGKYPYAIPLIEISDEIRRGVEAEIVGGTNQFLVVRKKFPVPMLDAVIRAHYDQIAQNDRFVLFRYRVQNR